MSVKKSRKWCAVPVTRVARRPSDRGGQLRLEQLEDRRVPVIGFNALAPVVARGGDFDGVVNINGCTGSLMATGRHILTAAHCVDNDGTTGTLGADGPNNVQFEMIRGATPIDINIAVPAAFIAVNGGWQGNNNIGNGSDIAILRLTDQEPGFSAIDRHLVAPFGAQRYEVFGGNNEVGQNYTIVGYGETGTGNTGQQSDEVQRVSIAAPVGGGTFTLTFNGQTTAAIAQNANAQAVAAALRALMNIGQDMNGVANVVVSTAGLPANTWDVRFVNQLGYTNVNQLTGAATGGATVNVATQFDGNQAGINNVKHSGQNRYDATGIGNTALRSDWDNGLAANDAIGGNTGPDTGFAARGDSGGPGFIRNAVLNTWEIASIVSFTQAQNSPPDINNYVDGNGNVRRDNSFGEARTDTRASTYNGAGGFIPTTTAGNYHLVLDMEQQVLGNDGLTENLTIIARRNGANLEIEVVNNSAPGTFAGVYYTAPVAELLSLTIRGTGDNETIRIDGDLGLNVTLDGRGGTDTLQMLNLPTAAAFTPDGPGSSQGTLAAYGDTITFAGMEFVTPVAPVITSMTLSDNDVNEAVMGTVTETVTVEVAFTDPGSLSSHEVTVDWGDGTAAEVFNLAVGARSFSRTHTYQDDNPTGTPFDPNTIQVTVTDNDDLADTETDQVTVRNVAPAVTALAGTDINENDETTLTGTFADPGVLDTHTVVIDWDDPNNATDSTFALPATNTLAVGQLVGSTTDSATLEVTGLTATGAVSFQVLHRYPDDGLAPGNGTAQDTSTVRVTVTDDDTGTDDETTPVVVSNVDPVITAHDNSAPSGDKAQEGEPVSVTGTFTDAGPLDEHTVSIDWGDGSPAEAGVVDQGAGTFSSAAGHAYAAGGIYTVTITLRDDDLGETTAIETVFVTGAGVQTIDGKQVLFVVGTNGADHVTVNQQGNGAVKVHADFLSDQGKQRTFDQPIDQIRLFLCAGDDRGTIAGNVDIPAFLDGGRGNDHLNAGRAGSVVNGGLGDDTVLGGGGRDVLIGGGGRDRLVANNGGDILIGGGTAFTDGPDDAILPGQAALFGILAEWNSGRTAQQRRDNLTNTPNPTFAGRLNGAAFLRLGVEVTDDGDEDKLTGGAGGDWFFAFAPDVVTGFNPNQDDVLAT